MYSNPAFERVSILVALVACGAGPAAAAGRPITFTDLSSLQRVSDPQVSPDGTRVLYSVAVPDVPANRSARNIWVVPVAGGDPRALTTSGHDGGGRWSPDGRRIAYVAGDGQLWSMNADGSDKKSISRISGGVDNIVWASDGRSIAFTSEVFIDCKDDACNAARDKAKEDDKVKAHVAERLLFRHWTCLLYTSPSPRDS